MDMFYVGPAAPGMSPFFKDQKGSVGFNGQNGRMIDWGHSFDAERGYRVFFKFQDSAAANTWGGESLTAWCDSFEPSDKDQVLLQDTSRQLAAQVIKMNAEWERLGRPIGGIPIEPKGRA